MKFTESNHSVTQWGDVAAASYVWSMTYEREGRVSTDDGHELHVFARRGQQWVAVLRLMLLRSGAPYLADARFVDLHRQFQSRPRVRLVHDAREVILYGLIGKPQVLADGDIAVPVEKAIEHAAFGFGELFFD
jgi:hypothetical protein